MKYLVLAYFEALLSNTECALGSCRENAITDTGIVCLITQMRKEVPECCAGGGKGACLWGEEERAVTSQSHPVLAAHAERPHKQLLPCDCFPQLLANSWAEENWRSMSICAGEGPDQVSGVMEQLFFLALKSR